MVLRAGNDAMICALIFIKELSSMSIHSRIVKPQTAGAQSLVLIHLNDVVSDRLHHGGINLRRRGALMSEMIVLDHKSISSALKEAFGRIADGNRQVNVRLNNRGETISFSSASCPRFYSNGMAITTVDSMVVIPYTSICLVEISLGTSSTNPSLE